MDMMVLSIVVSVYVLLVGYLCYYGYRQTTNADDYMLAGRNIHPGVMALSYGSTFISTSAIVGFGGLAAKLGMGLLWLTFMNILFGIIIAFVFFGKKTRRMGHNLNAQTFPEILGLRYKSRFIQGAAGLVVFIFMPFYSAAVLIGAARFMETTFPQISYNAALIIYIIIICAYVLAGGLKGVMYSEALQGAIMFIGMGFLLFYTYTKLGGVTQAHTQLGAITNLVPETLKQAGHTGWASFPALGSPIWWTMVSTIIIGVGVGVLAQPQLAVRFMTVKSNKELNRAVVTGGIFILVMIASAYVVGSLTNVYFLKNPAFGKIALQAAGGNVDKIIPLYINSAMPTWFVYLFMVTLLAAAMSTSSSQFHAMGTAVGRDLMCAFTGKRHTKNTMFVTRMGIILTVVASTVLGFMLPGGIIAIATAIFFSVCACTFLPVYLGGLLFRGITKTAAKASMLTGFLGTSFYIVFIHSKYASALGICKHVFGQKSLASYPWSAVDPVLVVLPIAAAVAWVVSMYTEKLPEEHLDKCFLHAKPKQ